MSTCNLLQIPTSQSSSNTLLENLAAAAAAAAAAGSGVQQQSSLSGTQLGSVSTTPGLSALENAALASLAGHAQSSQQVI